MAVFSIESSQTNKSDKDTKIEDPNIITADPSNLEKEHKEKNFLENEIRLVIDRILGENEITLENYSAVFGIFIRNPLFIEAIAPLIKKKEDQNIFTSYYRLLRLLIVIQKKFPTNPPKIIYKCPVKILQFHKKLDVVDLRLATGYYENNYSAGLHTFRSLIQRASERINSGYKIKSCKEKESEKVKHIPEKKTWELPKLYNPDMEKYNKNLDKRRKNKKDLKQNLSQAKKNNSKSKSNSKFKNRKSND